MNPKELQKSLKAIQIPKKEEFRTLDHAIVLNKLAKAIKDGGDFLVSEYIKTPEALIEYTEDLIASNDVNVLSDALRIMSDEIQKLRQYDCLSKHKHKSDIEAIRESLKRVETDPVFAKKVLIESGIYDEDMKLTPAYKYDGIEREKHEEAVLIIKEIKKRHTVGDYWIPNIDSTTKTTLILYNTNIEDNTALYSEMKEILDNSRFFDNIFSDRSPIVKYKDMLKE